MMPLALPLRWRYGSPVTVNPVAGRENPIYKLAHMRPKTLAGAFFVSAILSHGGRAWAGFGLAGCQLARFLTPRTAVTMSREKDGGSSTTQVGASHMKHALTPSASHAAAWKARAFAALRSNSSLSVRLARYNEAMAKARTLEAQEVTNA